MVRGTPKKKMAALVFLTLITLALKCTEARVINDWTDLEGVVDLKSGFRPWAFRSNLTEEPPASNDTCARPAICDFPPDFFDQDIRLDGGVVAHFIIALYVMLALAVVCDEYFVPCLAVFSEKFNLSPDIAGATIMAMGTSAPELFTNVIGTFTTDSSDIGLGTIIGTAVFNILAVAAGCGLAVGFAVPLEWWPLTRDCLIYGSVVVALIATIFDGRIEWWEALILVLLYVVYIAVMYFNKRIEKSAMKTKQNFSCNQATNQDPSAIYENPPVLQTDETFDIKTVSKNIDAETTFRPNSPTDSHSTSSSGSEGEEPFHPFKPPKESILSKFWWYLMWPSNILLSLTVPDVRRPSCVKFYIVSFIMSIFWIGGLTYVAVWMITIIGYTFGAPDTVMGITILAAGSSIPEAVSSIIVSRQGKGSMAISNSIGSNSFDILICLGLPWLIKAAALSSDGAVHVNSKGVGYSAIMLFGSVILLYVAIVLNKFKLDRKLGFIFLISYILFLVIASLTEMNVFFLVNQPQCRDC